MSGRHLRAVGPHGVYEPDPEPDDPGPAPDAVPTCPVCPADKPRDVVAVDKPAGFVCRACGWWFEAGGARVDRRRRELWDEETRPRGGAA